MNTAPPETKYTGNLSLYIFLHKYRQPTYLARNIRKVLSHHRGNVIKAKLPRKEMKSPEQTSPSSRRTHSEVGSPTSEQWTAEELVQILNTKAFGPQDPMLRIDVTDIKDRLAKFRDVRNDNNGPPTKQARTTRIRATCSLTIWDASSPKQPTIVEQSRKCEIHGKSLPSGERGASIELESPFLVRLQQLEIPSKQATHTAPEIQFSMQLVVMAANEHDPWPPVEMKLPLPKTKAYRDATGLVRFPVLAAKWHKLPRCPRTETESTLDLIASQDNNHYRPKLGLKINANWVSSPTPLETANAERRSRTKVQSSHSTPEPYHAPENHSVSIDWVFEGLAGNMPRLRLDGYHCPFCPGRDLKEASHFHFHLINHHCLFKYSFTLTFKNDEGRSVAEGTVRVDLSDEYEDTKGSLDIDWQKPKTPFDLEAYLKGDESWLGKKAKRPGNLLLPRAPSTPRTPRSRSHDASKHEIPFSAVTREADKVPDIEPAKKRRFPVPKAPDEHTRFFRLTTKRPLEEGESVSESDDNIDEEWILQKHADTIDSFTDTTKEEKEFIQRFDRHMLTEDVSSDLHSSEALIRFCRIYRKWLQNKAMRFEFHKKVATLKIQGCVSRKTIMDCMRILEEPSPKTDPDSMDVDTPVMTPSRTKTMMTIDPNASEIGDLYGRCAICHLGINHPRTYIFCTNPICLRPDHHLGCVSLSERENNWLCPACAASTPPHSTPPQVFHDAQMSPDAKRALPIRNAESSPEPEIRPEPSAKMKPDHISRTSSGQPKRGGRQSNKAPAVNDVAIELSRGSTPADKSLSESEDGDEFLTDSSEDDGDEYMPDDREDD